MKIEQQQQARNLFFETDLTQAQIAELVGISTKTMSLWTNEGHWKKLKSLAKRVPMAILDEMYTEIAEMNETIRARPVGKRFATREEADVRTKTFNAIHKVMDFQLPVNHTEVMTNFIDYLRKRSMADAKAIVKYADEFVTGEIGICRDKWESYPLSYSDPAGEDPSGDEPTPNDEGGIPVTPKGPGPNPPVGNWPNVVQQYQQQFAKTQRTQAA